MGDSPLVCPNEAIAPCGIDDRVIVGRRIEGSLGQSPGIESSLAGVCSGAYSEASISYYYFG